jgi:hypothetical protein
VKLAMRLQLALGILALACAFVIGVNPAAAADAATLVLTGGINATIRLTPANCSAGPGASLTVNDVPGGGWESLSLYGIDPAPGRRGAAELDLNGSGFRKAPYAVDDWIWKATKRGHISRPLNIAANGAAGSIDVVVPVSDTFLAPKTKAVKVALTWHAGACKPYASP